ncbi:hypothetical protein [Streptomyces griseus]|uniref:hypothetical protein n=1 Tax=Streptomyces griseus TaxID=1911 RepID=UPI003796BF76
MTAKRIPLEDHTSDTLDALYDERDEARLKAANLERDLRTERWYAEDRKRGLRLQRQRAEKAEARVRGLEGIVARVTRAVDAGPVGSCCAHIIRAALTPPTGLCGCGRADPGPCTPCPHGSTSLHCACVCTPQGAA